MATGTSADLISYADKVKSRPSTGPPPIPAPRPSLFSQILKGAKEPVHSTPVKLGTPMKRPRSPGLSPEMKKQKENTPPPSPQVNPGSPPPSPLVNPGTPETSSQNDPAMDSLDQTCADLSDILRRYDDDGIEIVKVVPPTPVDLTETQSVPEPKAKDTPPAQPEAREPVKPTPEQPAKSDTPTMIKVVWISMTLHIISGAKIVNQQLKETVHRKFIEFMTPTLCKSNGNWLQYQIRSDQITKARNFTYGSYDFNLKKLDPPKNKRKTQSATRHTNCTPASSTTSKTQVKLQKGQIHVGTQTWATKNKCAEYLQTAANKITSFYREYDHKTKQHSEYIKVTFQSEIMPTMIKTADNIMHHVLPALYKEVRCNKCQMFGHTTKACRSTSTKCPHCAGPHTHAGCKNKSNKICANCGGNHGAAYKGCPTYNKYASHINTLNNQLTQQHHARQPATAQLPTNTQKEQIKNIITKVMAECNQALPENLDALIEQELSKENQTTEVTPPTEQTNQQSEHYNSKINTRPMSHKKGGNGRPHPLLGKSPTSPPASPWNRWLGNRHNNNKFK